MYPMIWHWNEPGGQGVRSLIQWKSKYWNIEMFLSGRNVFARIITHQISWPICDRLFACLQFVFIFATFATLFSHPYAPFVFIWTGAQDHQTTFITQSSSFFVFFFIFLRLCSGSSFFPPKAQDISESRYHHNIFSPILEISSMQGGTTKLETFYPDHVFAISL